ncbi:MAG: hypothetical protein M0R77_00040 [Gammaproteobacteria bacterium]|nr:hypothetical protein [Acholeplasmataceae bacterium]MCK9528943.1 hypothetical protein [Gammaproteobacteria bacterium]
MKKTIIFTLSKSLEEFNPSDYDNDLAKVIYLEGKDLDAETLTETINALEETHIVIDIFEPFAELLVYNGFNAIFLIDKETKIEHLYTDLDEQSKAKNYFSNLLDYCNNTGIRNRANIILVQDNTPTPFSWMKLITLSTMLDRR